CEKSRFGAAFSTRLAILNKCRKRANHSEEEQIMKLTRWSPFGNLWNPLQQVQSEVNRLFDRWAGDERTPGFGGFPALNIWEDEAHCFVEAELPGVELK